MSAVRVWRTYGGRSPGTRAYVAARLANSPLQAVRGELAALQGRVLSLGAGVGVTERFLTLINAAVTVDAIEREPKRVEAAGEAERIDMRVGDAMQPLPPGPYDAALVFDMLHHLQYSEHAQLAANLAQVLRPGATVLLKDIATTPRWKHAFNAFHDRLVSREEVQCRAPEDMAAVFAPAGFAITDVRRVSPRSPYPHYLVCLTRS